ncbi:M28 family peptidase [Verrucomicrobiota bacterium sgz303538]
MNVGIKLVLVAALMLSGCKRRTSEEPTAQPSAEAPPKAGGTPSAAARTTLQPSTPLPKVPVSQAPPPREIWKEFSGERAMAHVRQQVEIGPRPAGSAELEKSRELITQALKQAGWEVERQEFTEETPRGPIKFVNLIGRFSADGSRPVPRNTQRVIVASHFDTKKFSTIKFVGASDGASSTGALMELARVLALDLALAAQVELVFFDGEEALVQFTDTDGLYGSRHYAKSLRESGRAPQFRFGIVWDMIGDSDLTITLPPDSPAEVARDLLASADALGLRQNFRFFERSILDDHEPLNNIAHIPTIDLIDFDYLYWHTADDTLDKLSPDSLQKVGAVTLHQIRKAVGK